MSGTRRWESCRALGSFLRSLGKCSWHPGDVHETQASLDGAAEGRCAGGCLFERRCAPPASKASWVLDATCSIPANRSMKVALSWETSGTLRPKFTCVRGGVAQRRLRPGHVLACDARASDWVT